jgi:hypothetical protein
MPDWQAELEVLLAHLQVSLDQASPPFSVDAFSTASVASHETDDPGASGPWDLSALTSEEAASDGDEVSAVRSEIEATVEQVVALVHAGRIETFLQDDVIFVLQALTRPHPPRAVLPAEQPERADANTEWHLASAAALLRFCRIVQRLTYALAREGEP